MRTVDAWKNGLWFFLCFLCLTAVAAVRRFLFWQEHDFWIDRSSILLSVFDFLTGLYKNVYR
jgi:hypothetical protein